MSMNLTRFTLALLAALAASAVLAETSADGGSATPATAAKPAAKLTGSFSTWAGSSENSAALVNGLRSGQPITLTETLPGPAGQPPITTSTTFVPPTKPMGYGNIKIALSLARTELAQQGITQPTPQQLQTALMGGPLTTGTGATAQTTNLPGVLQMRADGMGWGKIANTMGFKLGQVMSGKVPAGGTSSASAGSPGKSGSGITTAGGSGTDGKALGHAKTGGAVTTAGGGVTTGMGQGGGHPGGVVTAGGNNSGGAVHGKSGK